MGEGEDGCTKSVAGTGVSSHDGSGDITCALSSEVFEVETFAVKVSAEHAMVYVTYFSTEVAEVSGPDHHVFMCCIIYVAGNTGGD